MKKIYLLFLVGILSRTYAQQTFPVNGTTDPRHLTYAFTNATIYVDYKTIYAPGTLIIRDGMVIDVGDKAQIPDGAVVYNMKGKTIYPSLIDIFSDYGLPEVKKATPNDDPQFLSATKGAYNWNQAVRAEYDAYRNFNADGKKAEELRKLGFGTVMSVNRDGIVRGTSTLVLLGNGKENDLIIKNRAAANYSFNKGSSPQDYPGSLMGAIALLRQTYYDAEWYKDGGYKKEFNITLESFNNLRDLLQVFEVDEKQNALRAKKIGEEFKVNYVIKGAGDEFERIEEIKVMGTSLIVPLNFPEAFDLNDPYDAINISLRQMKMWELAPSNPGVLASNNIEFAITASDLKNKSDFWKNLRKAVDNGLSQENALKAITYTPAKLLGFSGKLGQLTAGSYANFIVTSKSLFDKDNAILENWVKGIPYRISDAQASDIRGNYSIRVNEQNPIRLKIAGEMTAPEASVFDDTSSSKISLNRQGQTISFQYELKKKEPKGTYRLTGIVNDSLRSFSGSLILPSGEWGKWTATFDSALVTPPVKPDSAKDVRRGRVYFPDMAYGWTELPVAKPFVIRNATVWTNESE